MSLPSDKGLPQAEMSAIASDISASGGPSLGSGVVPDQIELSWVVEIMKQPVGEFMVQLSGSWEDDLILRIAQIPSLEAQGSTQPERDRERPETKREIKKFNDMLEKKLGVGDLRGQCSDEYRANYLRSFLRSVIEECHECLPVTVYTRMAWLLDKFPIPHNIDMTLKACVMSLCKHTRGPYKAEKNDRKKQTDIVLRNILDPSGYLDWPDDGAIDSKSGFNRDTYLFENFLYKSDLELEKVEVSSEKSSFHKYLSSIARFGLENRMCFHVYRRMMMVLSRSCFWPYEDVLKAFFMSCCKITRGKYDKGSENPTEDEAEGSEMEIDDEAQRNEEDSSGIVEV